MSEPPRESRSPAPTMVRAVTLLDLFLGLWAVAIAVGYVYLRFENYRMVINGARVNMFGAFYAIVANAKWVAMVAGMDEVPGGSHNAIPDAPKIAVFGAFRVMHMFVALAVCYLVVAAAIFAMADGLSRGLRWARRAHVVLGWLGLAVVAGYAVLYWCSTYAPPAGLLVVAGSAAVPSAMIRAGLAPREESGPIPRRRRLGLPSWTLIASGLMLVAGAIHVVLAWWSLLLIKYYCF
jgi:hypothetical protein